MIIEVDFTILSVKIKISKRKSISDFLAKLKS